MGLTRFPLALLCATALLLCCVAPASAHGDHGPDNDRLTCATVKCEGGLICIIEDGTPKCVKPPQCDPACSEGKLCRTVKGQPKCVDDPNNWVNPCAFTTCLTGTICVAEPGDDRAQCISACSTVRCGDGKSCIVDPLTGRTKCVSDAVTPCAFTTCPMGTICTAEPGDDTAQCITACATVKCSAGKKCLINKRGKAQCVKEAVNPCAFTTCLRGTICMPEPDNLSAKCITACATVKCSAGKKCLINKKGNPQCVDDTVSPCAFTTCRRGTICVAEPGADTATCITKCASVRCASGRRCVVNRRGNPVCRPITRLF